MHCIIFKVFRDGRTVHLYNSVCTSVSAMTGILKLVNQYYSKVDGHTQILYIPIT